MFLFHLLLGRRQKLTFSSREWLGLSLAFECLPAILCVDWLAPPLTLGKINLLGLTTLSPRAAYSQWSLL